MVPSSRGRGVRRSADAGRARVWVRTTRSAGAGRGRSRARAPTSGVAEDSRASPTMGATAVRTSTTSSSLAPTANAASMAHWYDVKADSAATRAATRTNAWVFGSSPDGAEVPSAPSADAAAPSSLSASLRSSSSWSGLMTSDRGVTASASWPTVRPQWIRPARRGVRARLRCRSPGPARAQQSARDQAGQPDRRCYGQHGSDHVLGRRACGEHAAWTPRRYAVVLAPMEIKAARRTKAPVSRPAPSSPSSARPRHGSVQILARPQAAQLGLCWDAGRAVAFRSRQRGHPSSRHHAPADRIIPGG